MTRVCHDLVLDLDLVPLLHIVLTMYEYVYDYVIPKYVYAYSYTATVLV